MVVTEKQFMDIFDHVEDSSLDSLWFYLKHDLAFPFFSREQSDTFEKRKKLFFYFLERFLREGNLKLAKKDEFLGGSIVEQINIFREKFPSEDLQMDDGLWFFTEECPGGAVWIHKNEDGTEHLEWT